MIHSIGVKTAHSSILDLKKELLFFDQIHLFGDSAVWSLAEILIPEDTNLDAVSAIKNALQITYKLIQTGKTENKLLEQVFTEYKILTEIGLIVNKSESEILSQALKDKKKFKTISKTGNSKADEFHNMNHLLILMDNALKEFDKLQPTAFKTIKKNTEINEIPLEDLFKKDIKSFIQNEQLIRELSNEIIARLYSFMMNSEGSARFIPILDRLSRWKSKDSGDDNISDNKLKVINAVFKSLPMPSVNTPLIEVLDFKKDSEANGHILALNNWIIDASTKNLTALELEQKIEYLISEYERFIRINKLKFEASRFEIVITSIAEVAENLARLKFSKVANNIFQLFKNDLRLLEAEMNAPGKELAYISSARNKFGSQY